MSKPWDHLMSKPQEEGQSNIGNGTWSTSAGADIQVSEVSTYGCRLTIGPTVNNLGKGTLLEVAEFCTVLSAQMKDI